MLFEPQLLPEMKQPYAWKYYTLKNWDFNYLSIALNEPWTSISRWGLATLKHVPRFSCLSALWLSQMGLLFIMRDTLNNLRCPHLPTIKDLAKRYSNITDIQSISVYMIQLQLCLKTWYMFFLKRRITHKPLRSCLCQLTRNRWVCFNFKLFTWVPGMLLACLIMTSCVIF